MKIVLGLRFIQDLADIPLPCQKLRIKFRVRIPHAPDPEAVNIGCAALFDLVRNELGQLGVGGGRGHTDYQWDILGLGSCLEFQRGHMAGGVVDLSCQIAVRAGLP